MSLDPVVRDLDADDLGPAMPAVLALVMELKAEHTAELQRLEAAFELAGGRGVQLAERIDRLRADLEDLAVHTLIPLAATPAPSGNRAVARLCRAAAHLLVSAEAAGPDPVCAADSAVTAAAVAWVCIRGLGLDPDALDRPNGHTCDAKAVPLVGPAHGHHRRPPRAPYRERPARQRLRHPTSLTAFSNAA